MQDLKDIKKRILENSFNSLVLGIEDYLYGDEKRLISCVRNLYAGILLFLKYKLIDIFSSELIIMKNIVPKLDKNEKITFTAKGKSTIGYNDIKNRFLQVNTNINFNTIEKLKEYRNNLEHYYSNINRNELAYIIVDNIFLMDSIIKCEVISNIKELIGSEKWDLILNDRDAYNIKRKYCDDSFMKINWSIETWQELAETYQCTKCGSDLIHYSQNNGNILLECEKCKQQDNMENILEEMVNIYSDSRDCHFTDDECHICGLEAIVDGRCMSCGEEFIFCERCGRYVPIEDYNEDCEICYSCIECFYD